MYSCFGHLFVLDREWIGRFADGVAIAPTASGHSEPTLYRWIFDYSCNVVCAELQSVPRSFSIRSLISWHFGIIINAMVRTIGRAQQHLPPIKFACFAHYFNLFDSYSFCHLASTVRNRRKTEISSSVCLRIILIQLNCVSSSNWIVFGSAHGRRSVSTQTQVTRAMNGRRANGQRQTKLWFIWNRIQAQLDRIYRFRRGRECVFGRKL